MKGCCVAWVACSTARWQSTATGFPPGWRSSIRRFRTRCSSARGRACSRTIWMPNWSGSTTITWSRRASGRPRPRTWRAAAVSARVPAKSFAASGYGASSARAVRVDEYTYPGDPLRLDYSYRRNGTRGFIQALALSRDPSQAKVLAYTADAIRAKLAATEFIAVTEVEPRPQENERHRFVAGLLEENRNPAGAAFAAAGVGAPDAAAAAVGPPRGLRSRTKQNAGFVIRNRRLHFRIEIWQGRERPRESPRSSVPEFPSPCP